MYQERDMDGYPTSVYMFLRIGTFILTYFVYAPAHAKKKTREGRKK
jgi:hypothetical protein